ncbi:protein SAWADEE HOMEODOMAIN HOMOLOG 2-like [Triticum dicoccoides]|uniref:protein SAWADEE HOMEODOMAIN HOMOLOG 2-like n=1 Tax=Triticum dicoccoides TaxID=85692 RepID=UPI00189106E3|nr:protein SAWADEE HOMEODOMAIN HOMOLOG 2-like [Triticum dicoccoides]
MEKGWDINRQGSRGRAVRFESVHCPRLLGLGSSNYPRARRLPSLTSEAGNTTCSTSNICFSLPPLSISISIFDKSAQSSHCSGDDNVPIQYNQVRNWFQNHSSRMMMMPPVAEEHHLVAISYSGNIPSDGGQVQFEAKSARNVVWYDVAAFPSHRFKKTKDPEVLVRFTWLGPEDDEWVDVQKCVRLRSLQCVAALPGDLILCFKEGKEQAQYFDAHVLQVQRRRHDVRGCRCRFLVCYDHDHSEEFVPLSKVCRRPETDHFHQKAQKQHKMMVVNTEKVTRGGAPIPPDQGGPSDKPVSPLLDAPTSTRSKSVAHVEMGDAEAARNDEAANEAHGDKMNHEGDFSFRVAWYHLSDDGFPIKHNVDRLPPPLIADLNGDGR